MPLGHYGQLNMGARALQDGGLYKLRAVGRGVWLQGKRGFLSPQLFGLDCHLSVLTKLPDFNWLYRK